MRRHVWFFVGLAALGLSSTLRGQEAPASEPSPTPTPLPEVTQAPVAEPSPSYDPTNEVPASDDGAPPTPDEQTEPINPSELFDAAHELWQVYVPDSLKDEYEFPTREQWDAFFLHLRDALDTQSLAKAAELAPEVKDSLAALRKDPAYSQYADWLDEKLDLLDAAALVAGGLPMPTLPPTLPRPSPLPSLAPTGTPPLPTLPGMMPSPAPVRPGGMLGRFDAKAVPYYDVWISRIQTRPRPAKGADLLPALKQVFADEGVPQELVWLAEVESSLNPRALSPAGARGLFQLMPATAKHYGLSMFPSDERSHPEKSARAAARHLKKMRARFGDWPLALAAYNAGDGRVSRLLKAKGPNATFADIASSLSVETRMYVPKVLATVAVREGALTR